MTVIRVNNVSFLFSISYSQLLTTSEAIINNTVVSNKCVIF